MSSIVDIVSNQGLLGDVSQLNLTFSSYFDYYNQLINEQANLPSADAFQVLDLEK